MGRRDRERIQRVLEGKEEPISANSESRPSIGRATRGFIEGMTKRAVDKVLAPKWAKMTLPQQVSIAKKMVRTNGLMNFRANFLKDSSFPDDIRDKRKAGMTNDQIWGYYWGCPEFQTFWKDLELTEDNLRVLVFLAIREEGSNANVG